MTDDDKFFERLRGDAASLRHQVDDATLRRIRARIQERIAPRPSVAEVLVSWLRPLAAGLAVIALVAAIGLTRNGNDSSFGEEQVQIVMGEDAYRVGD